MLEYSPEQMRKLRNGHGGVWRIPPAIGGHRRRPLPRFTVLDGKDIAALYSFFQEWGTALHRVLVPGAHVVIATSPLLNHVVSQAMADAKFEKRGEIVRLTQTLRGGDRPKNAEHQFPDISVMARSQWEPWVVFLNLARVQFRIYRSGKPAASVDSPPIGLSAMWFKALPQEERKEALPRTRV